MSLSLNPIDIIEVLNGCFASIDFRFAAVKEGEVWHNVATVVRLSHEEPDARRKKLGHRIYKLPVETENLLIVGEIRPVSAWSEFLAQHKLATFHYGNREIRYSHPIDWTQARTQITTSPFVVRNFDGRNWPRVSIGVGGDSSGLRLSRQELHIDAARFAAPDVHTVVASTLGISLGNGHPLSYDVFVDAVIPLDITQPRILGHPDRLEFNILRHVSLSEVEITAEFGRYEQSSILTPVSRLTLERSDLPFVIDGIEEPTYAASFDAGDMGPWLTVRAFHPRLGLICQETYATQALFSTAALNPLIAVIRRFCGADDPKTLILNPELKPKHKTSESALFELRINWLLSTLGFSGVILGNYEKLLAGPTKHEYGSVDIIATHSKNRTLFLIGCSLDPPKEQDKDKLVNVAAVVEREVFANVEQRIQPLIMTSAVGCGVDIDSLMGRGSGVVVLDRSGLERLWDLAEGGNVDYFLRWLG
jgi:hypothetical protein